MADRNTKFVDLLRNYVFGLSVQNASSNGVENSVTEL